MIPGSVEVAVIRTGTANLASVCNGLRRAGAIPRFARDADDVREVPKVVLPGVGSFGATIEQLKADGLVEALRERVSRDRPMLAICVGLQVLASASEESPGIEGLRIVDGEATRLPTTVRVPQIGWNWVEASPDCRVLETGYAYFANSYRLTAVPRGASAAMVEYGGPFVAAFELGALLACQFHPELSGPWGLDLLRRWLEATGAGAC